GPLDLEDGVSGVPLVEGAQRNAGALEQAVDDGGLGGAIEPLLQVLERCFHERFDGRTEDRGLVAAHWLTLSEGTRPARGAYAPLARGSDLLGSGKVAKGNWVFSTAIRWLPPAGRFAWCSLDERVFAA